MGTMNISLPDTLRDFVDQQVSSGAYGTSSEYLRELIRHDRDRLQLRAMLLEGAESPVRGEADAAYFQGLRDRAAASRSRTAKRRA
ncbi:MAG TPA: type II toxin-antitoxin system ParD family antitoxin [Burkholderiaceae bacterium]|nr:type II toxin-antitoxin system ParD family antitoxin [Burkholderiaceae bacterium]